MPRKPVVKVLLLWYIKERGGSASFSEILEFYRLIGGSEGRSKGALGNILKDLVIEGLVRRDGVGRYVITEDGLRYVNENVNLLTLIDNSLNELALFFGVNKDLLSKLLMSGSLDFTFMKLAAPLGDKPLTGHDLVKALRVDEFAERLDNVTQESIESKLNEPGWTRVWYETDDSYVLDFFDPPGINTVIVISKEPRHDDSLGSFLDIDFWSAMIYPSESELETITDSGSVVPYIKSYIDRGYKSSFFVRLAYTYSLYNLFMIDSALRVHFNTKLLLGLFVMTNSKDGRIYFADFGYGYEAPQLIIDSVNVPGLREIGIDELNAVISRVVGNE